MLDNSSSLSVNLGDYQEKVDLAMQEIENEAVIQRIWDHDFTLWKPDPAEITNRLGWLHIGGKMKERLPEFADFLSEVRQSGFTQALLLGMGGSSLAPEVFRHTFGVKVTYLDLAVLDSTDPGAVLSQADSLDLGKSLFIVSTKSGGTVETLSFFKYFYNQVELFTAGNRPGSHFIAITDAGSQLHELSSQYQFRRTFLNDPNIGGRYSALSYFGLVPAALIGVDLEKLLDRSENMIRDQAATLGAVLGELARAGRDKLTLLISPEIASFGSWVEQLIAESTGKEGTGILPVVGEPVGQADQYGDDRLFVYLKLNGDATYDSYAEDIEDAGHPLIRMQTEDPYDLGEQFYLWELATAVAGNRLAINPFNQPNVESAKVLAREMVAAYQEEGQLPELEASEQVDGIKVYPDQPSLVEKARSAREVITTFLSQAKPGAYIALQAYLQPENKTEKVLQKLRQQLRDQTHLATTLGYGPRFLHSTGQLHKGDAGLGMFIQMVDSPSQDVPIPDQPGSQESGISFGMLKQAQSLGDRQALLDGGRRVLRLDLGSDPVSGIEKLIKDGE